MQAAACLRDAWQEHGRGTKGVFLVVCNDRDGEPTSSHLVSVDLPFELL